MCSPGEPLWAVLCDRLLDLEREIQALRMEIAEYCLEQERGCTDGNEEEAEEADAEEVQAESRFAIRLQEWRTTYEFLN